MEKAPSAVLLVELEIWERDEQIGMSDRSSIGLLAEDAERLETGRDPPPLGVEGLTNLRVF